MPGQYFQRGQVIVRIMRLLSWLCLVPVACQAWATPWYQQNSDAPPATSKTQQSSSQPASSVPLLLIGRGDDIDVSVYGAPELSQHVRVNAEWQLGGLAGSLDHPPNPHAAERLATFVDEDIG